MDNPQEPQAAAQEPAGQIVFERSARAFEFLQGRQLVRAHVALVLVSANGAYYVIQPEDQPVPSKLIWKRIRTIYEVDVGQHQKHITADLPCAADTFSFHAEIDLQWEVIDPCLIVRRHIVTEGMVNRALGPVALDRMRAVSRTYPVTESAAAEKAINSAFDASPLGADLGLRTRSFVRLSLDEATRAHAGELLSVMRQIELEQQTQQLRLLQEANSRELVGERMNRYREAIAAGDIEQFAMRIAENPKDIHAVMEAVRKERDINRRHAIDFFSRLAESNLIERYEMNDMIQETIRWLRESVDLLVPNSDPPSLSGRRQRRSLPPGRPDPPPSSGGAELPGGGPRGGQNGGAGQDGSGG